MLIKLTLGVDSGPTGRKPLSSVEIYDSSTKTWTAGPELPHPIFGAVMVQYGLDEVKDILTIDLLKSNLNLEHKFLTGFYGPLRGPWRGSKGSVKITKIKYCTHIHLFSGIYGSASGN